MATIRRAPPGAPPNQKIKGYLLKNSANPQPIIGIPGVPAKFLKFPPMNSIDDYVEPELFDVNGKKSKLGGMIYPITLGDPDGGSNTYIDAQGKEGSYTTLELDCALCVVDYEPNVVLTKIQGLPQTIKEFISGGDKNITITGIYNSTPDIAPMDFIANLDAIFNAPVPIPVVNYYLNELGITHIVVMPGSQMGQTEGGYASQTFTIKAISDVQMEDMLP